MTDKYIISTYCSPQPPLVVDEVRYDNRVTLRQYSLLKELGVNLAYGQTDIMNSDTEHYAFDALEICGELDMGYLVKDLIAREYCSLGETMFKRYKFADFRKLNEQQRGELDKRFEVSLRRYGKYKAFKGIIFVDEPGSEMFEGIARAKKVFDKVYPDKIFLVNLLPYYSYDYLFQFGFQESLKEKEQIKKEYVFQRDYDRIKYDGFYWDNNIERYEYHIKQFFDTVKPSIYSYDAYPFFVHHGMNTLVHKVLYEMPQIAHIFCNRLKMDFWIFLQCGGRWSGDEHTKVTNFADVQLSVSMAMACGAKAMQLYTGCYSNDCLPNNGEISGVIDEFGNVTNQYDFYRYAFRQSKAVERYLVPAKLEGMILSGEYFDQTASVEEMKRLEIGDIYKGKLPEYAGYEISSYKELSCVKANYQCLVSCFELRGNSVFLVVNTSPVIAADIVLNFDKSYEFKLIQAGGESRCQGDTVTIKSLPAGENVLVTQISTAKSTA